jgi:hypothetical protein
MKVEVKVVLDVNWYDEDREVTKDAREAIEERVEEAVVDALHDGKDITRDYLHTVEGRISITVDRAEATIVDTDKT